MYLVWLNRRLEDMLELVLAIKIHWLGTYSLDDLIEYSCTENYILANAKGKKYYKGKCIIFNPSSIHSYTH